MPDATHHHGSHRPGSPGQGWHDAFAALPLESPPASRWLRIAAAMPKRSPWPARFVAAGLAAAAALAVITVLPRRVPGPEPAAVATTPAPTRSPTPVAMPAQPAAIAAAQDASDSTPSVRETNPATTDIHRDPEPAATPQRVAAEPDNAPTRQTQAQALGEPARIATATSEPPALVAENPATGSQELERFQAESAQLESLLALARDDAVSSGAVAAVAAELTDQVELIDARLSQPSLTTTQRNTLWQARVDALRQLAGFETTQRLLAARGERLDTLLVSVD